MGTCVMKDCGFQLENEKKIKKGNFELIKKVH